MIQKTLIKVVIIARSRNQILVNQAAVMIQTGTNSATLKSIERRLGASSVPENAFKVRKNPCLRVWTISMKDSKLKLKQSFKLQWKFSMSRTAPAWHKRTISSTTSCKTTRDERHCRRAWKNQQSRLKVCLQIFCLDLP